MIKDPELLKYLPKFLEQTKNGVIVTDPNQKNNPIIYVNEATCTLFEYKKEDFLGANCKFLQKHLQNQKEVKKISRAIKERRPIITTVKNFTQSGKLIYNNLSISPIYDENGELKYFLGIQRDATHENLLMLENQRLQLKEIENTKFNTIGKLAGGLSHELNTPLTVIKGTMEMMHSTLQEIQDDQLKGYLQEDYAILTKEFKRLGNIVESLREAADVHFFEKKEINLYRTLIFSLRLIGHKVDLHTKVFLQDEEFSIDFDRDKKFYKVFADSNRLEQVWLILIENTLDQFAKKGIEKSKSELHIRIEERKDFFDVVFEDNGGGFEENILENIFTPFNTTTEHKGLGIGLVVAKQILEKHNFSILVTNSTQGAIVRVTIPKL